MNATASIVSKVWSSCTTLRDDGVSYRDYKVLFFDNREASRDPWTKEDLQEFIACYHPLNRHQRKETWHKQESPEGRWRK